MRGVIPGTPRAGGLRAGQSCGGCVFVSRGACLGRRTCTFPHAHLGRPPVPLPLYAVGSLRACRVPVARPHSLTLVHFWQSREPFSAADAAANNWCKPRCVGPRRCCGRASCLAHLWGALAATWRRAPSASAGRLELHTTRMKGIRYLILHVLRASQSLVELRWATPDSRSLLTVDPATCSR